MIHSPGPWNLVGQFDAEVGVDIIAADLSSVCEVAPFVEEWTDQEIANARLIAAAPELLDTLKLVQPLVAKHCGSAIPKKIAAVIAKAEGRDR
jgi:hypothetical protein